MSNLNKITSDIIGCAIKVHRKLGPGLLESAYRKCLAYELQKLGYHVEQEWPVPLVYETLRVDLAYKADLLVEGLVLVEAKGKDALHPRDKAQLLSQLRLLNLQVGLLINFHEVLLKDGIRRVVNDYREPDAPIVKTEGVPDLTTQE